MTVDRTTLGERLRLVRTRRGWSIAAVASGAGLSEARLYRIESGEHWPEPEDLRKLCDALGVDDIALRDEGDGWYARLKTIGSISGPHVFDLPTQFDPALSIENQVIPSPGLRDMAEPPAPKPAPSITPPMRAAAPVAKAVAPDRPLCPACQERPSSVTFGVCMYCYMAAREFDE